MHQWWRFCLGGFLLFPQSGFAENQQEKTMYLQTDYPPEASAEANDLYQPFFAAPSAASEVQEEVTELTARVKKLEDRVALLEKEKKAPPSP